MTAPWIETDHLAIAIVLGVAFGAALERAGLGSARKLVGQFFATDLTVFRVMFSAIVVAMLGGFWLDRAGLLELSRVALPETWLAPQLVGGLVFGAGMATAGLCPGTSCVAAATGRGDGVAVLLGMLGGVFVAGMLTVPLRGFYESTARGALTLPAWLGVSSGIVVLGVVVMALGAFAAIGRLERRSSEARRSSEVRS